MKKKRNAHHPFIVSLKEIQKQAETSPTIKIGEFFRILAGRGYAALLILLSFPFCFPLQIPGFSTPFGLLLSFLGLRIAFGHRLWWPKWILKKELPSESVLKMVQKMITFLQNKKIIILRPRLTLFTQNEIFHRIDGVVVFIMGIFLSLPLPIPMTNLLSALPILCIGLGLLEDDGLVILIGYVLAGVCIGFFLLLFILGEHQISKLFPAN